jgi:DUF1680 family protein
VDDLNLNKEKKEMTPEQRAMLETAGEFIRAIDKLTAALHYAADRIGFGADNVPPDERPAERNTEPPAEVKIVTDDDLKAALNKYARAAGKQQALDLVARYADSLNPLDIKAEDRAKVLEVANG